MQLNKYPEAIEWLFNQFPSYQLIGSEAYKPDLDNIRALCDLLGNPQNELQFIHVAGTNGKGSTSSMLASILTEGGFKTGLFTSPHIIDFRERIRVNGEMISEQSVLKFCNLIRNLPSETTPSFFEISFAMALVNFRDEKCTLCVIETGLGGRLDATNIINPLVSVITNISFDHTSILGNTLESIAFEKAGIIKQNVPVVIGESTSQTRVIFNNVAHLNNAEITWCESHPIKSRYESPLLGAYQMQNLKTALCTLKILERYGFKVSPLQIRNGLENLFKNTGLFGRMQIISKNPLTILDVSHNEDGIRKTLMTIQKINQGKLYLIYGSSSDKEYDKIMGYFPKDAYASVCLFSSRRSLSETDWKTYFRKKDLQIPIYSHVKEAVSTIKLQATEQDTILVFGSFFLISDFFS